MGADVTYAPDRIGYRYGVPDDAYSKGYHRGQDVRERGRGGGSVVTQVDAVDAGRVVYVGRPNGLLGLTVVIDTGRTRGRYESHSHLAGVVVSVGDWVVSGQNLARNAGMDEAPGMVDGPHDHITITDRFDGAWETWAPEYDPLPFIQAAYARAASTAGGNTQPFNPEEDDMFTEDDRARLDAVYAGVFGPANVGAPKMTWEQPFGEPIGEAYYGLLPITIYSQTLIARQAAQLAALGELVKQGGGVVDMNAVQAAAERGAADALAQFPTAQQIADAVNDDAAKRLAS